MGTLRSTQWNVVVDDDGNETRTPACKGHSVNGVLLGEPIEVDGDPMSAEWDHGAFPSGEVSLVEGELVVTVDVNDGPWDVSPWMDYRQALRDLPDSTTDPRLAVWPEEPA